MEKINKWIEYFKNLDLFSQILLLFAASQIAVIILLALKQYNIFDATPYVMLALDTVIFIARFLLIVGALGICYVLLFISFESLNQKSESESYDKMEEIKIVK
jgi:hypothetical protein